jgi:hypothetical protein
LLDPTASTALHATPARAVAERRNGAAEIG